MNNPPPTPSTGNHFLDFFVTTFARVIFTIRGILTGLPAPPPGYNSNSNNNDWSYYGPRETGQDLRTPDEKKSDKRREMVNAKQLYSNGYLIETFQEGDDFFNEEEKEGIFEIINDDVPLQLLEDIENQRNNSTSTTSRSNNRSSSSSFSADQQQNKKQRPQKPHPYRERNRMTTVLEPIE